MSQSLPRWALFLGEYPGLYFRVCPLTRYSFCPDLLATFPTLSKIFAHISKLPQFLAADWQHQPDTPEELRAA